MKKLILISMFSISIICTILLIGFSLNKNKVVNNGDKYEYTTLPANKKIYINGEITSKEYVELFIETSYENIFDINISNNQVVSKGDLLYKSKNDSITSQIKQNEKQLNSYEREENYIKENIEKVNAKILNLNEEIESYKKKIEETNIYITNFEGTESELDITNLRSIISELEVKIETNDSQIESMNEQNDSYKYQLLTVRDNINSLISEIDELKENEIKEVVAPIDGIVNIVGNENDFANPFVTITSEELIISGYVSEKNYSDLAVNQKVNINVISINKNITGEILEISNIPDDSVLSTSNQDGLSEYNVLIKPDDSSELISGYHIQATAILDEYSAIVPITAVVSLNNEYYVYKEVNSKLEKVKVEIRPTSNEQRVEIVNGVNEGNRILIDAEKYVVESDKQ